MIDQKNSYHFAIYNHKLVIGKNRLITRNFIVIKDKSGDIVCFTRLHNYVHSKRTNSAKSIADNGNNRTVFVVQFLNYIFFERYYDYGITKLIDITLEMIQDFFYTYGSENDSGVGRSRSTVNKCADSVIDFLLEFITKNKEHCVLEKENLVKDGYYYTKRGIKKYQTIPKVELIYSETPKVILRDMPDSVFKMILSYAASYYKDILMLIASSAFAGIRPSEACNVRQEISPLGPGIYISTSNGNAREIKIDLKKEYVLRSDLINVGGIKKEREQKVYPRFINAFMQCYRIYKEYMTNLKFEKEYMPLNVNRNGKAMTYATYLQKFRNMIKELIPIMLNSDNEEVQEYAHILLEHNISPHIFRHWFSVRLTLYGESVATLMYWRGDKSPESAITYLQNKSELSKRFQKINDEAFALMFDYMDKGGEC
ncbi:site-specific integrase [Eubacterium sp. AF17-7]|uniref:site-specific integrase n=1 Tax=Eubacterium sp. AF17-7 TaxID=2293105 RepID=UPI000E533030|nr:site-specific integrase [Eubacterium sp. AF17-7]RGG66651.1 site-specific integrase [Eubacterium sp. AF17-7]